MQSTYRNNWCLFWWGNTTWCAFPLCLSTLVKVLIYFQACNCVAKASHLPLCDLKHKPMLLYSGVSPVVFSVFSPQERIAASVLHPWGMGRKRVLIICQALWNAIYGTHKCKDCSENSHELCKHKIYLFAIVSKCKWNRKEQGHFLETDFVVNN